MILGVNNCCDSATFVVGNAGYSYSTKEVYYEAEVEVYIICPQISDYDKVNMEWLS